MGTNQSTSRAQPSLVNGSRTSNSDVELPHEKRVKGLAKLLALNRHEETTLETLPASQMQLLPDHLLQEREKVHNTRNASRVMKQLFKQLDPNVMTVSSESRGEVQLAFKVKPETGKLLIKVIQCKALNSKDLRGGSADPYVKLIVYPEAHGDDTKKTRHVSKSLNPIFNEMFSFDLELVRSDHAKLIVQVWDHDFIGADDFMGESVISLNELQLPDNETVTHWKTLQMETDLGITGSLKVRLSYRKPQTLEITIVSASGLSPRDVGSSADPKVKLTVPGIPTVYETEVCKNTLEPQWNETFDFPVPVTEFVDKYIVFHVIDHDRVGGNESLGQVIVDLDQFDPQQGFEGEFDLADLRNHPRLRTRWERHALVQEFRTALIAHAVARAPALAFNSKKSDKVICVRSVKAGTQARVSVLNGVPIT